MFAFWRPRVRSSALVSNRGHVLVRGGNSGRGPDARGQDRPHSRVRPGLEADLCVRRLKEQEVVQRRSHPGHTELEVDHGGGVCVSLACISSCLSSSFMLSPPSRLKGRFLLWPTTAAACSGASCLCWEECFLVRTRSPTAAATRSTSSTPTSPSGTSPSSQATRPPPAQGEMILTRKPITARYRRYALSPSHLPFFVFFQPLCLCDAGEEDLCVRWVGHSGLLQRHVHVGPR